MGSVVTAAGRQGLRRLGEEGGCDQPEGDRTQDQDGEQAPHGLIVLSDGR